MGACAMLPRIIGQGRAAELLYTGRTMRADEGERWGFYNRGRGRRADEAEARAGRAHRRRAGFANMMTKTMLAQEWNDERSNRRSRPRRRRRRSACRARISPRL
jgi:enoyl-CoA hydratase/carnithine racemase